MLGKCHKSPACYDPGLLAATFQQRYPQLSWIPRIDVSAQLVDESVTETTDDRVTEFGTAVRTRRRVRRRGALPETDLRRAPGGVAERPAATSESILPGEAAPANIAARHSGTPGIAGGVAAIREALRSMP